MQAGAGEIEDAAQEEELQPCRPPGGVRGIDKLGQEGQKEEAGLVICEGS
jgi:hypothetical protein